MQFQHLKLCNFLSSVSEFSKFLTNVTVKKDPRAPENFLAGTFLPPGSGLATSDNSQISCNSKFKGLIAFLCKIPAYLTLIVLTIILVLEILFYQGNHFYINRLNMT